MKDYRALSLMLVTSFVLLANGKPTCAEDSPWKTADFAHATSDSGKKSARRTIPASEPAKAELPDFSKIPSARASDGKAKPQKSQAIVLKPSTPKQSVVVLQKKSVASPKSSGDTEIADLRKQLEQAKLQAAKEKAAKEEAVKKQLAKQESATLQAKQEAEKLAAKKLAAAKKAAAMREAEKMAAVINAAAKKETERLAAVKIAAVKLAAAKREAARLEVEKQALLQREVKRLEALQAEGAKREAVQRLAFQREAQKLDSLKLEAQKRDALLQQVKQGKPLQGVVLRTETKTVPWKPVALPANSQAAKSIAMPAEYLPISSTNKLNLGLQPTLGPVAKNLDFTQQNKIVSVQHEELQPIDEDPEGEIADGYEYCDDGCGREPIWTIGIEATFLVPSFNSANMSILIDDISGAESFGFGGDDIGSVLLGSRVSAGIQGECWGIVARYWGMNFGETAHDPFIVTGSDTGFTTNNRVEAYTADLELTRAFVTNDMKLTASIGARYASLDHEQSIFATGNPNDDLVQGSASAYRHARGPGLTFALAGRRPLFCNSCVNLFFNARGSMLWGPSDLLVQTSATLQDSDGSSSSFNGASIDANETFIGEIQLGLEWNYELNCIPANAFLRVAAEYQYWGTDQGAAGSNSFAEETGVTEITSMASLDDLEMNLMGLTIGTGFTW